MNANSNKVSLAQTKYLPQSLLIAFFLILSIGCQKDLANEEFAEPFRTSNTGKQLIGFSYDLTTVQYQEVHQNGAKISPQELSVLDQIRSIPIVKKQTQSFSFSENGEVEMDIIFHENDFVQGGVDFSNVPENNVADIKRVKVKNGKAKFYDTSGNLLANREIPVPDMTAFARKVKESGRLTQELPISKTLGAPLPDLETTELIDYLQENLGATINVLEGGNVQALIDLPHPISFSNHQTGDQMELMINTIDKRITAMSVIDSNNSQLVNVTVPLYDEGKIVAIHAVRYNPRNDGTVELRHNIRSYENYEL